MTGFEALEHLLEEDAFMGRVLVEQHESAFRFEQHVQPADDADDAQRALEQGDGMGAGPGWDPGAWQGCSRHSLGFIRHRLLRRRRSRETRICGRRRGGLRRTGHRVG